MNISFNIITLIKQRLFSFSLMGMAIAPLVATSTTMATPLTIPPLGASAVAMTVPDAIIVGSTYHNKFEFFNLNTLTWSELTTSLHTMENTIAAVNTKFMIAGGMISPDLPLEDRVNIYNTDGGKWSLANLAVARRDAISTTVGDKILFAGGLTTWDKYSATAIVDVYDDTSGQWSVESLSQARQVIAAASANGVALFAGGIIPDPSDPSETTPAYVRTVDIYDSHSKSWSTSSLPSSRLEFSAIGAGTKIFFAGGLNDNIQRDASRRVDIYDTETHSWSTANLSEARSRIASTTLGTKVFFAGGSTDYNYSDVVDIYDLATNQWSTAKLSSARSSMTAAARGGYAIFAAGLDNNDYATTVDYYRASDNSWSTSPTISSDNPGDEDPTDQDGQLDSDNDGVPNSEDACPTDPNKSSAGFCGCGVSDIDTNSDGMADCFQYGISLNKAALFTKDPLVSISVVYPPNTTRILVSNDGGFSNYTSFPPAATLSWELEESGTERTPKTVYVRFIGNGLPLNSYTDDIILDQSLPVVQTLLASKVSSAQSLSPLGKYKLTVKAKDNNSGVKQMQLSTNKRWVEYKSKFFVSTSERKLKIRVKDGAGNISNMRSVKLK